MAQLLIGQHPINQSPKLDQQIVNHAEILISNLVDFRHIEGYFLRPGQVIHLVNPRHIIYLIDRQVIKLVGLQVTLVIMLFLACYIVSMLAIKHLFL